MEKDATESVMIPVLVRVLPPPTKDEEALARVDGTVVMLPLVVPKGWRMAVGRIGE